MTKTDAADETFVVETDPLAPRGDRKAGRDVAHLGAGEGDVSGIGDDRTCRSTVESVEIIFDDGEVALSLDQCRPAIGLGLDPAAQPQGQGFGVGGEAVLIDCFIAEAGFAERLDLDGLGMRRPGRRERQQVYEGAGHD